RLDPRLGAAQLRRRDELHRARDLARVADRADSALVVLDGCHRSGCLSRCSRGARSPAEPALFLDVEPIEEPLERLVELRGGLVREILALADRLIDGALGAERLAELLPGARHLREGGA